jgi:hypothetical protein
VSPVFPLSWLRYFLEQHQWRLALASQSLYVLLLEEHAYAENLGPKQATSFQLINVEDESAKRSDATAMCGYRHDLPPLSMLPSQSFTPIPNNSYEPESYCSCVQHSRDFSVVVRKYCISTS